MTAKKLTPFRLGLIGILGIIGAVIFRWGIVDYAIKAKVSNVSAKTVSCGFLPVLNLVVCLCVFLKSESLKKETF